METFHMTMDEIMYKYSWLNISLLMLDKLKYKGEKKDSGGIKKKSIAEMTDDEFFKSLM